MTPSNSAPEASVNPSNALSRPETATRAIVLILRPVPAEGLWPGRYYPMTAKNARLIQKHGYGRVVRWVE